MLLSSLTANGSALAQGSAKGAPAAGARVAHEADAEKEATRLYEQGVKAVRASQWEQAREAFGAAFRLKPHYQIAANLGRAELRAGKPREAAEHLAFFLREAKDEVADEDLQAARQLLLEARSKLAAVRVQVDTVGAEVFVDGETLGRSPLTEPVYLDPGNRRFEARKLGLEPVWKEMDVAAGTAPVVALRLSPPPVVVLPSALGPVAPEGEQKSRWKPWGIGIGAGVAAVGLGVGIGFSVASSSQNQRVVEGLHELQAKTPQNEPVCSKWGCGPLVDLAQERDKNRNVAIAGFVVGGVGAAGALAAALWKPRAPGAGARPTTGLSVAPFHRGLLVNGSF
jgi:hypothetical protein